jgi:preprotein translocase subunit SecA
MIMLQIVDSHWKDHLLGTDYLRKVSVSAVTDSAIRLWNTRESFRFSRI